MSSPLASPWRLLRALTARRREAGDGKKFIPRDPRHAIRAPMIYRQRGGLFWYEGTLEDFSLTGVRFRGEKYLPLESPVEMSFAVPQETGKATRRDFFCWTKVVRAVLPAIADGQFGIAARILRYRSKKPVLADYRAIVGEVRGPFSDGKSGRPGDLAA